MEYLLKKHSYITIIPTPTHDFLLQYLYRDVDETDFLLCDTTNKPNIISFGKRLEILRPATLSLA